MKFLVLQHIDVEHPGSLRGFMAADGIRWDSISLDRGDTIPPLDGYAAMLVMGGPMDTWQEDTYSWLTTEKAAIRTWVAGGRPFLGICLGHQLLADALGGVVGPMAEPEVGIRHVTLSDTGASDPLLAGLSTPLECLQWHGSEIKLLPRGATVLAHSEACPVQAFRVGRCAYGIQFHVEVTADTVAEWGCVPAYTSSLEVALGVGAQARLQAETAARLSAFTASARTIYDNFRQLGRAGAPST